MSRFVIGFFGAEFQIGTTHVASATTREERSTAMTVLAGCLSIAYMMAPGETEGRGARQREGRGEKEEKGREGERGRRWREGR